MDLAPCIPIFFSNPNSFNLLPYNAFNRKYWPEQILKVKQILAWRKSLNQNNYQDILQKFIVMHEGLCLFPYLCPANIMTIGPGIVLYQGKTDLFTYAKSFFDSIGYAFSKFEIIEASKNRRCLISEKEALLFLNYVLGLKRASLLSVYPFWNDLPFSLRVGIESLNYNREEFVRGEFEKIVTDFYMEGCPKQSGNLEKLLFKIFRHLNKGAPFEGKTATNSCWEGLQYRRYLEMIMCSNDLLDSKHFPNILSFNDLSS